MEEEEKRAKSRFITVLTAVVMGTLVFAAVFVLGAIVYRVAEAIVLIGK